MKSGTTHEFSENALAAFGKRFKLWNWVPCREKLYETLFCQILVCIALWICLFTKQLGRTSPWLRGWVWAWLKELDLLAPNVTHAERVDLFTRRCGCCDVFLLWSYCRYCRTTISTDFGNIFSHFSQSLSRESPLWTLMLYLTSWESAERSSSTSSLHGSHGQLREARPLRRDFFQWRFKFFRKNWHASTSEYFRSKRNDCAKHVKHINHVVKHVVKHVKLFDSCECLGTCIILAPQSWWPKSIFLPSGVWRKIESKGLGNRMKPAKSSQNRWVTVESPGPGRSKKEKWIEQIQQIDLCSFCSVSIGRT